VTEAVASRIDELSALRTEAGTHYFEAEAQSLASTCHRMAERFAAGGRLLALGGSPQARSDARHVAVEFVHPVIVGKRALPALALCDDVEEQFSLIAEPGDIVIGFDEPLDAARRLGCLVLEFDPPVDDPFVHQELSETTYHLLWELVHVFFEHRGLLEGRDARPVHDTGASSFLYPFLGESETDLEGVLSDVEASVRMKAAEIRDLRSQTLEDGRDALGAAASAIRSGGRLLTLGNGGSATDAMDAAADMRHPPHGWPARSALDLTEDSAILTAIANDIGTDAIFARQVIAHGREGDVLLAMSTSGNSVNVIEALAEARRRAMVTIAMVGYDGGRVAEDRLADHVVITRSEHIPRIQEAQASAWHVLRELIEL
jgi:D-sedoheptulose 7-phosphate isomerase